MPYQSKDWKINDIIREDDLDHIEQGLQETSEIAENNSSAISEINNILNLTNTDSILKKYIDEKNAQSFESIPLIDTTLTLENQAADSKTVGDFITLLQESTANIDSRLETIEDSNVLRSIEDVVAIKNSAEVYSQNSAMHAENSLRYSQDAEKSAIAAASSAEAAANNSIAAIEKYLYYKSGDVVEKTQAEMTGKEGWFWICPGYISNSSTGIYFSINLGKPIIAKKFRISNLKIAVRSYNGYVGWGAGGSDVNLENHIGQKEIVCPEAGVISLRLDYSAKWPVAGTSTATTNNRPCSVTIETIKIEFYD